MYWTIDILPDSAHGSLYSLELLSSIDYQDINGTTTLQVRWPDYNCTVYGVYFRVKCIIYIIQYTYTKWMKHSTKRFGTFILLQCKHAKFYMYYNVTWSCFIDLFYLYVFNAKLSSSQPSYQIQQSITIVFLAFSYWLHSMTPLCLYNSSKKAILML